MPRFLEVSDTAAARAALGVTDVGDDLITANDATSVRVALGEDPYRVERLEQIKAAATIWSNLVTDEHFYAGSFVPAAARPVSVSKPSLVTGGGANLLSDLLPLTAGTVPTGTGSTTVNDYDGDTISFTMTQIDGNALGLTGSLLIDWTASSVGDYLFACTVQCLTATTNTMELRLQTSGTHTPKAFYVSEERVPRYTVTRLRIGDVADTIQFRGRVLGPSETAKSAQFIVSDMMIVPETTALPPFGGLLGVPPYSQTTASSADITLSVPAGRAGEHMVLVKTVQRGWIASRGTLSSGTNNLSSLFTGANMTVEEILAIPVADWQVGDLDVISPPRFRGLDFVYTNNVDADGYPRYYADASMMTGDPVGALLAIAGTPRPYAAALSDGRGTLNRLQVYGGDNNANPPVALGQSNDRAEIVHGTPVPPDTDVWISTWLKLNNSVETGKFAILSQLKSGNLTLPGRGRPDFALSAFPGNTLGCAMLSNRNPTVAATGNGATATITYANTPSQLPEIGDQVTIAGMVPSGYNGTHTVTARSTSAPWTVSFASSQTGSQTTAGIVTVQFATQTTRVNYEVDRWHRSVMKVNFSRTSGGTFAWWWDGVEIFNGSGEFGYFGLTPDPAGVQPGDPFVVTHGIYRDYSEVPLAVDFQHFTVSTASLQSHIDSPMPI